MAPDDSVDDVEEAAAESASEESAPVDGADETDAAEAEEPAEPVDERPAPVVDEVLLASVDLARTALLEITPAASIGDVVGSIAEEDHVLSLHFESKLAGYPGWHWTVTISRIDESSEPSVLEIEMLPGENALIAPDWVPWSERLAEYTLAQELAEATAAADDGESDEDDDDLDDEDGDESDEDDDDHDLDDGLDLDDGIDIDDHVTDDDELEAAAEEAEESDGDESDEDDEDDDESEDEDDDEDSEDEFDDDTDDDPHAEGPWSGR